MSINRYLPVLLLLVSFKLFAQNERPNIIFILVDDQSYNSAGFNGNDVIKTPNLDKLANEGIVLDNFYNTTAICMASRAQIMTGMMEYKTATNFMHGSLSREKFSKSYPVLLRKAGYEVSFAGKFGFPVTKETTSNSRYNDYEEHMPIDEFDIWRGATAQSSYNTAKNKYMVDYAKEYPHSTRSYGAWATDYIKSKKGNNDKPFCMSISFKAPHIPNDPDPFFDNIYKGVIFPFPDNYGRINAKHLPEQARNGRQYMTLFYKYGYNESAYQESMKKYYQLIYGVDYAIGQIVDALKETGLEKNTVIIYTSDNGYFLGAHGFAGKVLPYEEGVKAPFIFFDPRNKNMGKRLRSNSLVGNIDIAPTILELAGIQAPDSMDGISMLSIMDKPNKKIREFLPVVNMWGAIPTHAMSIQTEKYKYIYWPYEGGSMKSAEELYDKKNDILEMHNLVNNKKYGSILERMRKMYDMQVDIIKKDGVDYNNYGWYKIFFDRHVAWADKEPILMKSAISNYKKEIRKSAKLKAIIDKRGAK